MRIGMMKNASIRRAGCDGHDVTVADRRHGDHREVHQVDDAEHLAMDVLQTVAVEVQHGERQRAESGHQEEPLQQHATRRRGGPREQGARARRLPGRAGRTWQAEAGRLAARLSHAQLRK
jgi:hypothetical protein